MIIQLTPFRTKARQQIRTKDANDHCASGNFGRRWHWSARSANKYLDHYPDLGRTSSKLRYGNRGNTAFRGIRMSESATKCTYRTELPPPRASRRRGGRCRHIHASEISMPRKAGCLRAADLILSSPCVGVTDWFVVTAAHAQEVGRGFLPPTMTCGQYNERSTCTVAQCIARLSASIKRRRRE
jgi:hypothetical protein